MPLHLFVSINGSRWNLDPIEVYQRSKLKNFISYSFIQPIPNLYSVTYEDLVWSISSGIDICYSFPTPFFLPLGAGTMLGKFHIKIVLVGVRDNFIP
jgi:hypothetical protein